MKQFVTFRLREQLLGIEILLVREINQQMEKTFVQLAPPFLCGLANLRGQIVSIFDLATRLGLKALSETEHRYNIVLKTNGELAPIRAREDREDLSTNDDTVGLAVDAIGDVLEVDEDIIEPVPANMGTLDERYLQGIVPMKDELLILLDAGALVTVN